MVALPEGTQLDKFVLVRVLGEGGFGITYLAEDLLLGKKFAIKEYFPQSLANREQSGDTIRINSGAEARKDYKWGLKRFLDEARTLAKFNHPNIINVNSVFEANNTAYMVLDYAEGADFGVWLRGLKRPPAQKELDDIARPLLEALAIIHANNILHRDIAPDNIYIRGDGTPVLLDFGAAREAISERTKAVTGIWKPGYSPSEQLSQTSRHLGPWTDIYAFAATLYRAVAGHAPQSSHERKIRDENAPAATAAQGEYRASFLKAIDDALQLDYEKRPQTVSAWKKELLSGAQSGLASDIGGQKTRVAEPPTGPERERGEGVSGRGRRWAAALALAAALGAGGYALTTLWPPAPEPKPGPEQPDHKAEERKRDDAAWAKAQRENSTEGYNAYLAAHPKGRHVGDANEQIASLEKAAEEKRDDDAYAAASKLNTVAAYEKYLEDNPQGRHAGEARREIASLKEEAAWKADDDAYAEAKKLNTVAAYEEYLKAHPEGKHVAAAEAQLVALEKTAGEKRDEEAFAKTAQTDTLTAYRNYLEAYPDGRYKGQAIANIKRIELIPRKTPKEFRDCPGCPQMVVVSSGQFDMGSPESEPGRPTNLPGLQNTEGPQRAVTISKSFAVGKFEVTRAQFETFVRETAHSFGQQCRTYEGGEWKERPNRNFLNPGFSQDSDHPVVCVSWNDAKAYVAWLSKKSGKTYRLLSEAEWEYAARAGTATRFSFGYNISRLCEYANFADRSTRLDWRNESCSDGVGEKTATVGGYKSNFFGINDMHGNVWEWVEDCWLFYSDAPTDGRAWTTRDCSDRVLRGGSWFNEPKDLRSAARGRSDPNHRFNSIGFRVARDLTQEELAQSGKESGKTVTGVKDSLERPAFKAEFRGKGRSNPRAIAASSDGGYVVVGQTVRTEQDNTDMWVLRLDPNGKRLWSKSIGGKGDDWASAVTVKPDGKIVVIGVSLSNSAGSEDLYVSQLSANGKIEWIKQFGGKSEDAADSLAVLPNGDIVVAIAVRSRWLAAEKPEDEFNTTVLYLNDNGREIRRRVLKLRSKPDNNSSPKIAVGGENDIFVAGSERMGSEPELWWLAKIGKDGKVLHHAAFPGEDFYGISGLLPSSDGGVLALGEHSDTNEAPLVRFGRDGRLVWQKKFRTGLKETLRLKLLPGSSGPLILGVGSEGEAVVLRVMGGGATQEVRRYTRFPAGADEFYASETFSVRDGLVAAYTSEAGEGRDLIFAGRGRKALAPLYDAVRIGKATVVERIVSD